MMSSFGEDPTYTPPPLPYLPLCILLSTPANLLLDANAFSFYRIYGNNNASVSFYYLTEKKM